MTTSQPVTMSCQNACVEAGFFISPPAASAWARLWMGTVLRFNAYADNDQMPIVRIAIDWGDGPDPYVIQGWFKNRKEKCGEKSCNNDANIACDKDTDCGSGNLCQAKVHFGNSPTACEDGYYQFTHIYECTNPAGCSFVPKVQVLDNWGWCNSLDGNGRWNDNNNDETKKSCRTDNDNVGSGENNPWTSFGGTIEVKQ